MSPFLILAMLPILRGDMAIGSSALITPLQILTAAHVFKGEKTPSVACGAEVIKITAIQVDPNNDLAVAQLETSCQLPLARIAGNNSLAGEQIKAVGCPALGACGWVATGHVMGYMVDKAKYMVSDMPTWFGNSGGPVYNASGELVGIVSKIQQHREDKTFTQKLSLAVPLSEIVKFLGSLERAP